ncbi:MAG: hypothetical protein WBW48_09575 [Anaerolineae bacterium]
MMKRFDVRAVGGILLIVVGILLLLQGFEILGVVVALIWALVFGAAGLVFLYVFLTDRANWWAAIPGFGLLGIAALIALDEFWPQVGDAVGGALFLGGIGLAFWVIYFINRKHWWAVIPGGVMFTLALVAGLESVFEGAEMGGVFFLGLGLTFGLLSFAPTPHGRMKWALIPAAVLLVMGLLITAITTGFLDVLFAAALILVGLYFLFRVFRL